MSKKRGKLECLCNNICVSKRPLCCGKTKLLPKHLTYLDTMPLANESKYSLVPSGFVKNMRLTMEK